MPGHVALADAPEELTVIWNDFAVTVGATPVTAIVIVSISAASFAVEAIVTIPVSAPIAYVPLALFVRDQDDTPLTCPTIVAVPPTASVGM